MENKPDKVTLVADNSRQASMTRSAAETFTSKNPQAAALHSRDRVVFRYSLAIVSVAVALGVGLLARQYGIGHQFAMLLFAVAVAGWNGGLGPAIVAAVISSLAYDYFITAPLYTLG